MKAAVIVVNWNGKAYLPDCLESLRVQEITHQVIFVDNGSTDGSCAYVREAYPEVELIELKAKAGFAIAANEGMRKALSDGYPFIALFSHGTKANRGWISAMIKSLEDDDEAGICASKMLYMDEPEIICSTGQLKRSGEVIDRGEGKEDNGQYDHKRKVFGASGSGCMFKRQMLDDTGLFDAEFGSFYEDADLSWRANKLGWKAVFEPKAIVLSKAGAKENSSSEKTPDGMRVDDLIRLIKKNGSFTDKLLATTRWTFLYLGSVFSRALGLTKSKMIYGRRVKGIW